jgi:cytochrome c-type biogenesis protein CcmF
LLVLVGIGPALPWGEWSPAARARLIPGAAAAATVAILLALVDGRPAVVLGGAAGAFALVESIWLLARRIRALRLSSFRTDSGRHSLGGLTAHIGFGVIGLAVLASSVGRTEVTATVRIGESVQLGDVHLFLDSVDRVPDAAGRDSVIAQTRLQDGQAMTAIGPALTLFPTSNAAIATPAVMPGAVADLYVTLTNVDPAAETVTLRLARYPFVSWLWVGGGILAAGGLIAAWPAKRRSASPALGLTPAAVSSATEAAS